MAFAVFNAGRISLSIVIQCGQSVARTTKHSSFKGCLSVPVGLIDRRPEQENGDGWKRGARLFPSTDSFQYWPFFLYCT